MPESLLEIQNLTIKSGEKTLVKNISLNIGPSRIVGLVGESGSGKTLTALSILGILPKAVSLTNGNILLTDNKKSMDLAKCSLKELNKLRGKKISMIFEEPMTSLNPSMKCGKQALESLQMSEKLGFTEAKERILELFHEVNLPEVERIFNSWPHELSGGQRQRVMIAMALASSPMLLIADEPTTALDVTVQKGILELLLDLKQKYKLSILFITHDLQVIKQVADEIAVMYQGEIVETGSKKSILNNPKIPYTKGLLSCKPRLDQHPVRLPTIADFMNNKQLDFEKVQSKSSNLKKEVLLSVKDLNVTYKSKNQKVQAVKKVSFDVFKGETLGLVGESGCGKTTIGRAILQLIHSYSGLISYKEIPLNEIKSGELRALRRKIQIVFQDPYSSLNPSKTIGNIISEPLIIHNMVKGKVETENKLIELLKQVGLEADAINLYPHQFSGGQRQRIGIARALACDPEFIVLDESVSALDVSVQAQILNLLNDLKDQFGLTYVFISHDLTVVKYMSDRVMVMSEGKIIESGTSEQIYLNPKEAYNQKIIDSIPV